MKCENGCDREIDRENLVIGSVTPMFHKRLCIFCAEELNYCETCGSIHFDSNLQLHFSRLCKEQAVYSVCNRCHRTGIQVFKARFGEWLCERCAAKFNMCFICGSTGANRNDQRHYNEYCFK